MIRSLIAVLALVSVQVAADISATDLPTGVIQLDAKPAPALALQDMDGKSFNLGQAKGGWVLIHFWASWCGPCRREMPTLQKLSERLVDIPFKVVLVNTAETDDDVFEFLTFVAPDLATLMDYDGRVTEIWQPRGLPASFFVDPEGRTRYLALGDRLWDSPEYVDFILALVKSASSRSPL